MTRGGGPDQRLSDLGFIPDKYCLACSVMSMLGRVFPQAIMFHLTSSWNIKMTLKAAVTPQADPNLRRGRSLVQASVGRQQRVVLSGLFW